LPIWRDRKGGLQEGPRKKFNAEGTEDAQRTRRMWR
jgi:hypothetical protein